MISHRALMTCGVAAALAVGAFALRDWTRDPESDPAPSSRRGVYGFDLYQEDRRLHLLLVDYRAGSETPALLYQRSDDGGETWSGRVRVDEGALPAFVPYRGVDPQLAARGNAVVAVWTAAGDDVYGYGTGPLAAAVSSDGGRTWRAGPNPADDGLTTAHEFLDVMADAEGRFHLIWIDDRDDDEGVRRGLRYAHSTDGGVSWSSNATLDEHICGCCWTHLRTDPAGRLYALYREEHPDPSDMKLMVSENGGVGWSDLGYVGAFGWMQNGCPHTTAGLTFLGPSESPEIHALVQTGKDGLGGVYHLVSRDGASAWTEPSRIAEEGAHYSDLAASGSRLGAVWQDQSGTRTVIYGRQSTDGGKTWSKSSILSDSTLSSSYPRIVSSGPSRPGERSGDAFRVFWIESPDGSIHRWASVRW